MNKHAIWHQAKTEFSYAYDEKRLHIVLKTAKNDFKEVFLISGDPFQWDSVKKGDVYWVHQKTQMSKRYQNRDYDYYFLEIKPPFFRIKYMFLLHQEHHRFAYGSKRLFEYQTDADLYDTFDLSEFFNFPFLNHEDLHHTPSWVKDTVWYQIFLDRFYHEDGKTSLPWGNLPVKNHEFYGGNLKGVIKKLPYLKDLGITGIYFTPLFKAPSAHKYDTTDYFQIDPQFGSNLDFKQLVKKAHDLGIKVMLDGVFNHAGYDHPFFQDVIRYGEDSLYKDCFFINQFPVVNFDLDQNGKPINYHKKELNYLTFAFTPFMPKWNTKNQLAEKHLLDCVRYWISTYDIDGWRLDVSNEISHDFLRKIKEESRKIKKDTFILGENWDSSLPWLKGDQLDSVMNYDLSFPLWKYLEQKIDLDTFKDLVINYLAQTPKNVMENMFNLVGSHDTVRIKRRLDDDPRRVKLAYVFIFLSAGAQNIYYGDELGLTGDHDPDNRRCMIWNLDQTDQDFFSFVKKLIALRNEYSVFKTYDYHFFGDDILSFTKKDDSNEIVVFINNGKQKDVQIASDIAGNYINLLSEEKITLYDKITLKTYGFLILKRV